MSDALVALIIFGTMILVLLLKVPVFFTLFGVGLIYGLVFLGPEVLYLAYISASSTVQKDIFIAIPLFVLMASILQRSGIAEQLYDTMYKWMGPVRGGLAIGTILICTLLAALTGLGSTGVLVLGLIALPEMLKRGYDKSLVLGCIPAGSILGPIIPPSVLMIIAAGFTQVSVGRLFAAGIIPGLIMSVLFCSYILLRCAVNPRFGPALPQELRSTWRSKFWSLLKVIPAIALITLVLGGIYAGAFTPTEAGSVGAVGALICAAINRQLNIKSLKEATLSAFQINSMVMCLLIGGMCFTAVLSATGVSNYVSQSLVQLPVADGYKIMLMLVLTLILGMLIDAGAVVIATLPIFAGVASGLGFDMLWFTLIITVTATIGYITPPFAMNLFVLKGLTPDNISMDDIYSAILPYVGIALASLAVVVAFPSLTLWLPKMMK